MKSARAIAFIGISLTAIGVSAEYFDTATRFRFEWISDYYDDVFGLALIVGVLLSFIGLIVWARYLSRPSRVRMAATVFLSPWLALLLGYPIDGFNMHGAAAFVIMLIIPATILAIVLLLLRGNSTYT